MRINTLIFVLNFWNRIYKIFNFCNDSLNVNAYINVFIDNLFRIISYPWRKLI